MYFFDYTNKLVHFDLNKYNNNYDRYYAYYKLRYNIIIPKLNKITDTDIIEYLNETGNLFSL